MPAVSSTQMCDPEDDASVPDLADNAHFDIFEEYNHWFVLEVQVRSSLHGACSPVPDHLWHGRITHIPSGSQRRVRTFAEIVLFISRYVSEIGTE